MPHDPSEPILRVENLSIHYRGTPEPAARNVSFTLGRERLGIVGESGSGKSTVGRALLRLLPTADITANRMTFRDIDLLHASERTMLKVRGNLMTMILQDPKFSLNPIQKCGDQISEAYLTHVKCPKKVARDKAIEMLKAVQIRDPERVYELYPHEVSGGMGQRIMIAMMLEPRHKLHLNRRRVALERNMDIEVEHRLGQILDHSQRVGQIADRVIAQRTQKLRARHVGLMSDMLPLLLRQYLTMLPIGQESEQRQHRTCEDRRKKMRQFRICHIGPSVGSPPIHVTKPSMPRLLTNILLAKATNLQVRQDLA